MFTCDSADEAYEADQLDLAIQEEDRLAELEESYDPDEDYLRSIVFREDI